jgi:nucleotide-binding universal stress UspA family protein
MNIPSKFGTIVVATDLSGADSPALRHAQAIARLHGSKLVLVHVLDPVGYAFPHGTPSALAADRAAREEIAQIEQEMCSHGIPVHSVVESGLICERVLQAVNDHHADLLVLGTKAGSSAGRLALGTVARQLLAKAPCPVLTVSANAEPTLPWAGRWRHVLATTDFSPSSLSALHLAQRIVHSQLLALHVSSHEKSATCSRCLERLRFLAPFNESHTVPVDHVVAPGDSADVIVEFAKAFHADLVVLGSPDKELSDEDLPTSTVLRVISRVTCPVLCVPAVHKTQLIEITEQAVAKC